MTATPPTQPVIEDPVVVYDVMWEVANRLRALYVGRITDGGDADPAIIAMGALDDEVESIDPTDLDAQRAKIAELRHRHEHLVGS